MDIKTVPHARSEIMDAKAKGANVVVIGVNDDILYEAAKQLADEGFGRFGSVCSHDHSIEFVFQTRTES